MIFPRRPRTMGMCRRVTQAVGFTRSPKSANENRRSQGRGSVALHRRHGGDMCSKGKEKWGLTVLLLSGSIHP